MADHIDPIDDLLAAYALDALDDDERREVEVYLAQNPRAAAEVAAYREVAAMLSFGGGPAPERLWQRIESSLDEPAPSYGPELSRLMPETARSRPASRSWRTVVVAGVVAAAAAAAAALIVVTLVDDNRSIPPGDAAVEWAYGEAWADPAAQRARLVSEDGSLSADAVIERSGAGYLAAKGLPALPDTQTYQLWGVYSDGDVISLGVIGARPTVEAFTALGEVNSLVITLEQAGGVVSSTSGALLAGDLA